MSAQTPKVPLNERQTVAEKLVKKYPDKIPVIVNHIQNKLIRTKYIVPADITVFDMISHVRKMNDSLEPNEGLFFFANNMLITPSMLMSELYTKHKAEDKFLYITCASENTFGNT